MHLAPSSLWQSPTKTIVIGVINQHGNVITRGYPPSDGAPRDPSATRSAERWSYWTSPIRGSSGWANEQKGVEMGIASIAGWLIMENSIFRTRNVMEQKSHQKMMAYHCSSPWKIPFFRFLRWKNYFCHDKRLAQFSLAIHFGIYWASTSAVIYAARQASMNLINHEGVQDGNFMRLCNQTDCFRELRGCFWVPWLWLWKINLQQRAPISANERELKRCAFFKNSHVSAKNLMKILSWEHFQDINCTTTGQWWQSWRNPGNVSARASLCTPMSMTEMAGVLKGWLHHFFLAAVELPYFLAICRRDRQRSGDL